MLPSADESVAANTPALISPTDHAMSPMMKLFATSSPCGRVPPKSTAITRYTAPVTAMAVIVPIGRDLAGFFKSPDMFAPAMMPVTAGKKRANMVKKLCPGWNAGFMFSVRVTTENWPKAPPKKRPARGRGWPGCRTAP